jgi:hypothetical protein
MFKIIITSMSLIASSVFGIGGQEFDATQTTTQTITGTLSANLAIAVSSTGNSNTGENGDTDCNTNFWTTLNKGFERGNVADSPCTWVTFSSSTTAWHIDVETTDDVKCGFMFIDDTTTANWDGDTNTLDTLLTHEAWNTSDTCNAQADQKEIDTTNLYGSSVFLVAEGFDQDAVSGSTGADCTTVGVTNSAGSDGTTTITAGTVTANTNGFGEGLIPDDEPGKILSCTSPVDSGGMFVIARVVVPNTALDGAYEMNLTWTIDNGSA